MDAKWTLNVSLSGTGSVLGPRGGEAVAAQRDHTGSEYGTRATQPLSEWEQRFAEWLPGERGTGG
ncbi:MAG: hypothetical protein JWN86_2680 [Planctomycetota bacterium]|nr:hypothetical protein [Planctomycetota bacterium]